MAAQFVSMILRTGVSLLGQPALVAHLFSLREIRALLLVAATAVGVPSVVLAVALGVASTGPAVALLAVLAGLWALWRRGVPAALVGDGQFHVAPGPYDVGGRYHCGHSVGTVAVVTGGSGGLGKYVALGLAERGATVVLACRDVATAAAVAQEVTERARRRLEPRARDGAAGYACVAMALDLADPDSVFAFVASFTAAYSVCHVLVNNAGVMVPPKRPCVLVRGSLRKGGGRVSQTPTPAVVCPPPLVCVAVCRGSSPVLP